ncbi:thiamine pyrophosphate-binding protein [Paenibacillus chitinolyticus]|uniref:thiamine pyrophosphate-binding protein n=1 Tax=Paenibacillus chitinolyticus TaxID=79263 RepID=UPI0036D7CCE0
MYIKEIVALWLKRMGIHTVFGIPGSYVLPMIDEISRKEIRFVLSQHEYGAALMADGFAKASGAPACVITTTGIGATNALSGIVNSFTDSQPVILLTGQVPISTYGKGALQECVGEGRTFDLEALMSKVTKYSKLVESADHLLDTLKEAEMHLWSGRKGPVHICIPIDVQFTEIHFEGFEPFTFPKPTEIVDAAGEEVSRLGNLLKESQKPLLLLGAGANYSHNEEVVEQIADLGIPIATTLRGKGIISENHPHALGCTGLHGRSAANYYLYREADLVIAVGVSMSEFTTQGWDSIFDKTPLVQVDIDPKQIGKNYEVRIGIAADSETFLLALYGLLEDASWEKATAALRQSKHKFADADREKDLTYVSAVQGKLHPVQVIETLQKLLPQDKTIWVTDPVSWTETHLLSKGAGTYIEGLNGAAIGYAPPAAIGAKCAKPDSYVVSIFGDGGFRQTALEMATATSHEIPVLWLNLNNEKFESINNAQKSYYKGNVVGTSYKPIDYVAFGESMQIDTIRVTTVEELQEAAKSFLREERPLLLDIQIVGSVVSAPKFRQLARYKTWKLTTSRKSSEDMKEIVSYFLKNRY